MCVCVCVCVCVCEFRVYSILVSIYQLIFFLLFGVKSSVWYIGIFSKNSSCIHESILTHTVSIFWQFNVAFMSSSSTSSSCRGMSTNFHCPVGWGCRIHRLHLCRGVRPPSTSVLDMTLNNLMVRFQQCWSFGECGEPLHYHRSQVHSVPEW